MPSPKNESSTLDAGIEHEGAPIPTKATLKVSTQPASPEEKAAVDEILLQSSHLISDLKYPTDDVIGPWRVLRFVRHHRGNLKSALKLFTKYLKHRLMCDHLIEDLGQEVRGKSPREFMEWYLPRSNRNAPYCPYAGEADDGTVYFWVRQGATNAEKFVKERPEKLPLTDDFLVMIQSHEWMMWYLNERCKALDRMCYMMKLMDFGGTVSNPMTNRKMREFMNLSSSLMAVHYCDGDSGFVFLDTPSFFNKFIYPVMRLLTTSRQRSKMMMLNDIEKLPDYVTKSHLPAKFGGSGNATFLEETCYTEFSREAIAKHLEDRIPLRKSWSSKPLQMKDFSKYT